MADYCKFWLPKKRRYCSNSPFVNSEFCGNHTQRSDMQWIPCPIDSSHCVLEENLKSHLNRCPLLKQSEFITRQPFYQKGINASRENEEDDSAPIVTSEMKRGAVYAMSVPQFLELVAKIKAFHAALCNDIRDSFVIPKACSIWTNREVDKKLPYQEKHVLQQASILGNLEEIGVLKKAASEKSNSKDDSLRVGDVTAVVEFGAGRGYLTQMLVDCYGIVKVLLVDRKSYKLKADRSLRKKEGLALERLRIDIQDLDIQAVESLHNLKYIATGKHLCGPATDLTLRCCIRKPWGATTDDKIRGSCSLTGLAVATCCHHLCQWKTYINKRFIIDVGFTMEDFNAISWFTSWAVDSDHSSELSLSDSYTSFETMIEHEYEHSDVGNIVRNMQSFERADLGNMCKDIIDTGRQMWVRGEGLSCELIKYVPCSISPENRLLVAAWPL